MSPDGTNGWEHALRGGELISLEKGLRALLLWEGPRHLTGPWHKQPILCTCSYRQCSDGWSRDHSPDMTLHTRNPQQPTYGQEEGAATRAASRTGTGRSTHKLPPEFPGVDGILGAEITRRFSSTDSPAGAQGPAEAALLRVKSMRPTLSNSLFRTKTMLVLTQVRIIALIGTGRHGRADIGQERLVDEVTPFGPFTPSLTSKCLSSRNTHQVSALV